MIVSLNGHLLLRSPLSQVKDFDFSFSGLKTSLLYFVNDMKKIDSSFVEKNINDICASYQHRLIKMLMAKLIKASKEYEIKNIAIAGGVAANSGLRQALQKEGEQNNWKVFIPEFQYCTDNAAMIAITAHYKFLKKDFCRLNVVPIAGFSDY